MENKMGTITTGKYADLVILNSNPLKDIKNTQDIYKVILKGRIQN
ncbi:MAG: amidohydrolase family protein [Gammaproteobacteria bacterium]